MKHIEFIQANTRWSHVTFSTTIKSCKTWPESVRLDQ